MSEQAYPVELLLKHAAATPNKVWLRQPTDSGERSWTWGEAASEIGRMAAALQKLGLPAGSRIAITGRNTAHWFMADLAIALAGYVSVGLYPKQAAKITQYILEHSETQAIFIGPALDVKELHAAVPEGITTIAMPYAEVPGCDLDWDAMQADVSPI
ncbi:MAG: AMP-binding protein, partial [Nevskiales bacterium]